MKNLHLFAFIFLAGFMAACQKNKDVQPLSNQQELPVYTEKNSAYLSWDQLPDNLKNAKPLPVKENHSSTRTTVATYAYQLGPWGGQGGQPFFAQPNPGSKIHAIAIRAAKYVDKIIIWYKDSSGNIYVGGDQGGTGGNYYLHLFGENEYIVSAFGRAGAYIDQLGFRTNIKQFYYGGEGGFPFSVSIPNNGYQILGFFGRSGKYLDNVGFYVYTF